VPGNNDCLPCAANSASDAARTACVCVAAQGWQETSAVLFACEQVERIITQRFELSTSFDDFVNNQASVRTNFIQVLATVYVTTPASISLQYFSANNPTVVKTARRLLLSQVGVDKVIITAQIKSFQSITPPDDTVVQLALQTAQYTVVLLPKIGTQANNCSSTPWLWIVVICGVFCVLGISVCIVVYVRSYQRQRDASQTQQDQIEDNWQTNVPEARHMIHRHTCPRATPRIHDEDHHPIWARD